MPNCLGPDEIIEKLNMENIKDRDWSVYECSALKGTGVKDGIQWIFEKLSDKYQKWYKFILCFRLNK